MIPQHQEVLKGPHVWSKKSMAGAAFIAFNACLAEAHSSLLVYTWRWESQKGLVVGRSWAPSVADPVG